MSSSCARAGTALCRTVQDLVDLKRLTKWLCTRERDRKIFGVYAESQAWWKQCAHAYQIAFAHAHIPLCSVRPLRRRCIVGRALHQADCCHVAILRGSGSRSYTIGVHYGSLLLLLASCAVDHHCPAHSTDSHRRSMIDTRVAFGNVHVSCRRGQLGKVRGVHIPTNPIHFGRCAARG